MDYQRCRTTSFLSGEFKICTVASFSLPAVEERSVKLARWFDVLGRRPDPLNTIKWHVISIPDFIYWQHHLRGAHIDTNSVNRCKRSVKVSFPRVYASAIRAHLRGSRVFCIFCQRPQASGRWSHLHSTEKFSKPRRFVCQLRRKVVAYTPKPRTTYGQRFLGSWRSRRVSLSLGR